MPPKTVPRTMVLGQRGINLIERIVLEMGSLWYPTGSVEAGIDGEIELRDSVTGQALNLLIAVQSKAVEKEFQNETDDGFDYYCSDRDLEYWLQGNLPVLLILSRPRTDEAYWVAVKDYFQDPSRRASRKVHFDKKKDRFDIACQPTLLNIAAPRDAGIYLAPPPAAENLISNLLPVAFLPARIYQADTEFREPPALWAEAQRRGAQLGGEWILRRRRILGFVDLTRPEWEGLCDRGTAEDFDTEEWSQSDDIERKHAFIELLRQTLRQMVYPELNVDRKRGTYYFRATHKLEAREFYYQGQEKATHRTVFSPYKSDDGRVMYYRHSAFRDRFVRFNGQWYLEITPTYHFTKDGEHPLKRSQDLLKGIKRLEGHEAVRGQVLMWAEFLRPRADLLRVEPYPYLGFYWLRAFEVDRGIPDAAWAARRSKEKEPEEEAVVTTEHVLQTSLF